MYLGISKCMIILRLDDPLDAVAVHAGGGKQILSYFSRHTLYLM